MRCYSAALLAVLCGCSTATVVPAQPSPSWPDAAQASSTRSDGALDAALIIAGPRRGANDVARAWARYLQQDRGVSSRRVILLDGQTVRASRIRRGLRQLRRKVRSGGTLWLIYLGHGSTALGATPEAGTLDVGAKREQPVTQGEILQTLGLGLQHAAVFVADACLPNSDQTADRAGGIAAIALWREGTPPRRGRQGSASSWPQLDRLRDQMVNEANKRWLRPADVTVITSGLGARCRNDDDFPWLGYATLLALRGAADTNGDLRIATDEAALWSSAVVADNFGHARIAVAGTNLVLARTRTPAGSAPPAVPTRMQAAANPTTLVDSVPLQAPFAPTVELGDQLHVPAGTFTMGCVQGDRKCEADERPAHEVELSQFSVGRHEVSWDAYARCLDHGGCEPLKLDRCYVWQEPNGFELGTALPKGMVSGDRPVVCATWQQAADYCRWAGMRLPTETQWERAARGDTRTVYPWGNARPTCKRSHHDGCGSATTPVDSLTAGASPVGALNMAGNVWEWTQDWYAKRAYDRHARKDPRGPGSGDVRIVRGGSFYGGRADLRTSYRYGLSPEYGYSTVGFRCVR